MRNIKLFIKYMIHDTAISFIANINDRCMSILLLFGCKIKLFSLLLFSGLDKRTFVIFSHLFLLYLSVVILPK